MPRPTLCPQTPHYHTPVCTNLPLPTHPVRISKFQDLRSATGQPLTTNSSLGNIKPPQKLAHSTSGGHTTEIQSDTISSILATYQYQIDMILLSACNITMQNTQIHTLHVFVQEEKHVNVLWLQSVSFG